MLAGVRGGENVTQHIDLSFVGRVTVHDRGAGRGADYKVAGKFTLFFVSARFARVWGR